MRVFNKKIAVFLMMISFCGISMFVKAGQSTSPKSTKPLFNSTGFTDANQPNRSLETRSTAATNELFVKMTFMVLIVVILGAAALYVSKRLLPRFTHLPGKKIQVIETVHLGPRKTVHLLKVAGQLLLIGCTNENITRLSEITEPLETDFTANRADDNRGIQ